jgi:NAD(P)H dehydrogenase (quinone)
MILITGASGKTGRTIVKLLKSTGEPVRAIVHRAEQVAMLKNAGAIEVFVGDLQSRGDLETACQGINALYHICPNMHPQEVEIARLVLAAAVKQGVERFVYHSVFHPQIEAMPHHWNKMRVEELIFTSGIPFTILQPCAYMQNVQGYWPQITANGIYPVPYSVDARLSVVDIEDVAQIAMQVLVQPGHEAACYELCGPEPLSQTEVATIMGQELGRPVKAVEMAVSEWDEQARTSGLNDYARQTLLKMFEYYNRYGLVGNPSILASLLKRQPIRFSEFVRRIV